MSRGFECDDGWFDIIDVLCERIQFLIDHNDRPQVVAQQVKEKFGTLRFCGFGGGDDTFTQADCLMPWRAIFWLRKTMMAFGTFWVNSASMRVSSIGHANNCQLAKSYHYR